MAYLDLGDVKGSKGDLGKSFLILGHYNTLALLKATVPFPEVGDAYSVGTTTPYDIYIFDGPTSDWLNYGPFKGVASLTLISGNHANGSFDTYRMTFTDGSYTDLMVWNGKDGSGAGDMVKTLYDSDADGVVNYANALSDGSHTLSLPTLTGNGTVATKADVDDVADDVTETNAKFIGLADIKTAAATLTVAGWSNKSQTVNVTGATADNIKWYSPDNASYDNFIKYGLRCTTEGAGTMTFSCIVTPGAAISINVVIAEVRAE